MAEPQFSEAQLQQAANAAYVRATYLATGRWILPIVPSLNAEYLLGWDTGFDFWWLPQPPRLTDEGCNFFLQYKLSSHLTSANAAEWAAWKKPYFRFKIPHLEKDSTTKKYVDDYHQWDRLKALAAANYPTFYATNWTLERNKLAEALDNGSLLNELVLLDVATVNQKHKYATFTLDSAGFFLHSDPTPATRTPWGTLLTSLLERPSLSLGESVTRLIALIVEIDGRESPLGRKLVQIDQMFGNIPRSIRPRIKFAHLAALLHFHWGVSLLWLPQVP